MNSISEPRPVTDPALEEVLAQLIHHEVIFHPPGLGTTGVDFENTMARDFWEVGASGRRYSRSQVLEMLEERSQQDHRNEMWETSDFYCKRLCEDIYLLTYTLLQQRTRKTRRSSIWQQTQAGWKIVFHQGTIVQDA
jgi:hypothetical protein